MRKRLLTFYSLVLGSIIALILFVEIYPISHLDLYMTMKIQKERAWDLTYLMKFISSFGNALLAPVSVAMAYIFFYLTYHRREAYFTLAVVIADLFNLLVKALISRPRPTIENAKVLLDFTQTSFPSGHVVHYVVFFGFLLAVMLTNNGIRLFWRIVVGIFSMLLIITVSLSRMFLGAHWMTDVIGGYLFGFIYLGVILAFYFKNKNDAKTN
ncbi:MAG: phosphatase PAP2 family protein [Candidatus Omnitrophica bacterium]|nr:phosphatase PAP2 family protein [Candidatus Omnitrophota bacterium]